MCTTCGCGSTEPIPVISNDIQLERRILAANDAHAEQVRSLLVAAGTVAVNLLSSPGAGKTTLLEQTLKKLRGERLVTVIEGDQHTSHDAERIRQAGAQAVQVNTGKVCHLEARMVVEALAQLAPPENGLLFIENVGNLICPADFDLGENKKVVLFSVTEGEDKPIKYPNIFHAADLVIISKTDLLPHLRFDADKAIEYVRQVNPVADIILLSSEAEDDPGFERWLTWLEQV